MRTLIIMTLLMTATSSFADSCNNIVGSYLCGSDVFTIKKDGGRYSTIFPANEYALPQGEAKVHTRCSNGKLAFSKRYFILGFDPMKVTQTFARNEHGDITLTTAAKSVLQGGVEDFTVTCSREEE